MKVDNALILAAGTSTRFAPISRERHKAMVKVRGEVLIERQIRQLKEAGIQDIYIVTGYKAEQFDYLKEKFGVQLIHNPEYMTRNNNSSIRIAGDILRNTYVCSSDNYFSENPFETEVDEAYYSGVYSDGSTKEWCMSEDEDGYISAVSIGGENSWYMLGHTFWSEAFSRKFLEILDREYELPETKDKLWETIYLEHLDSLKMKIRKYDPGIIFEFDTLDELREFDHTYLTDCHSIAVKKVSEELGVKESEMSDFRRVTDENGLATGFSFTCNGQIYRYLYESLNI